MVGIFSPFMVAGLLTASPAGFTFDGPEVTARTVGNVGYFTQGPTPFADPMVPSNDAPTRAMKRRAIII